MEIGQAKGMPWKITFHLPLEAIKHERKFPEEEVRYLSQSISTNSPDTQHSGMIGDVMALAEGEERMRPLLTVLHPQECTLKLWVCCSSQTHKTHALSEYFYSHYVKCSWLLNNRGLNCVGLLIHRSFLINTGQNCKCIFFSFFSILLYFKDKVYNTYNLQNTC